MPLQVLDRNGAIKIVDNAFNTRAPLTFQGDILVFDNPTDQALQAQMWINKNTISSGNYRIEANYSVIVPQEFNVIGNATLTVEGLLRVQRE